MGEAKIISLMERRVMGKAKQTYINWADTFGTNLDDTAFMQERLREVSGEFGLDPPARSMEELSERVAQQLAADGLSPHELSLVDFMRSKEAQQRRRLFHVIKTDS